MEVETLDTRFLSLLNCYTNLLICDFHEMHMLFIYFVHESKLLNSV